MNYIRTDADGQLTFAQSSDFLMIALLSKANATPDSPLVAITSRNLPSGIYFKKCIMAMLFSRDITGRICNDFFQPPDT